MNGRRTAAALGIVGLSASACGADQSAPSEADDNSAIEYTESSVLIWTWDHMAAFDTDTGDVHFSASIDDGVFTPEPPKDDWSWVMGGTWDEEVRADKRDPDVFTSHWLPAEEGGDLTTAEVDLMDVEGLETANLVDPYTYYEPSPTEDGVVYTVRAESNDTAECTTFYGVRIDLHEEEAEVVDTAQDDHRDHPVAVAIVAGLWEPWKEEDPQPTSSMCTPDEDPTLDTPAGDILPLKPNEDPEDRGYPLTDSRPEVVDPEDISAETSSVEWIEDGRFYQREEDDLYYALEGADGGLALHRMNPNGSHEEIEIPDGVDLGDHEDSNRIWTLPYGG